MSARFSRGTSVLAALVLVALLGGVMVALDTMSPRNTAVGVAASQLAQAAKPTVLETSCANEKIKAAASGGAVSAQTTSGEDVKDLCVGAIFDSSKPNAQKNDPNSYKCVGRVATVKIKDAKTGDVSVTSIPSSKVPEGLCSTFACGPTQSGGTQCFQAEKLAGINADRIMGYLSGTDPDVEVGTFDEKALEDLSKYLKSDSTQNNAINSVFDTGAGAVPYQGIGGFLGTESQEKYLQGYFDDLNKLSSGVTGEDGTSLSSVSKDTIKNAFLGADQKTLTPIDPAGEQPGVAEFCKQTGSCVGADGKVIQKTVSACTFGAGCPGASPPPAPPPGQSTQGGGGGLSSLLGSLLQGLSKALGGGGSGSGSGQANCTSDQSAYNSQLQAYNQQLQQYNQQLQQYNYQTQIAQIQGYPPPPQPVAPSQPCYKAATPTTPTNPTTPTPGGAPSAQISCQPKVADVGMSVAVSYSCGNSTSSAGSGFDTGGATSGSASVTVDNPPAGATAVTYGVQCRSAASAASAQCTVQLARPSIILVANPKVVEPNASSTIGWLTTGMDSCVISSPDLPEFTAQNALNTSVNGTALTPAIPHATEFILTCTTLGGATRDASVFVRVVGEPDFDVDGASSNISVESTADGTSIARGATTTISWTTTTVPTGGKVILWLYDTRLASLTSYIVDGLPATGTYTWTLPAASDTCSTTDNKVCYTDLVPGRTYGIEAALYTETSDPNNPNYLDYNFTPDVFTVSQ